MIQEFVDKTNSFSRTIEQLKMCSPTYPELYKEEIGDKYWVSSMVSYTFRGVEYKRHHVESCRRFSGYSDKQWAECKETSEYRLQDMADLCQQKAIPCSFDEVVRFVE